MGLKGFFTFFKRGAKSRLNHYLFIYVLRKKAGVVFAVVDGGIVFLRESAEDNHTRLDI